jgi:hypothetical protein
MSFLILSFFLFQGSNHYYYYCLSLYHFNIQYVPGGLKGYFKTIFNIDLPEAELNQEEIEERIVKESFEPILDIYLQNPSWGADIELQGYMIEVMKNRFPEVLSKLKVLVDRNQIDLISIHYSDQLFLAYPLEDMEWSLKINDEIIKSSGLKISPVIFAQEGQTGEGLFRFLKNYGYRILVVPVGLFEFLHSNKSVKPLYSIEDGYAVIGGKDIDDGNIKVKWTFFDDGELAATGGANPYFGTKFKKNENAIKEMISKLKSLEGDGCKISKISTFVEEITRTYSPERLPPLIDGTWHPERSMNMFRWMGGKGEFANKVHEKDNKVLTNNYKVSLLVRAAEILMNEKSRFDLSSKLEDAKKEILLAEVSDSTGWNPWTNEINYSLEKAEKAQKLAQEIISEIGEPPYISLKEKRSLNSYKGLKTREGKFPIPYTIWAEGYSYETKEEKFENIDAWRIEIRFFPDKETGNGFGSVKITFPLFEKIIEYSPSLLREVASYNGNDFSFKRIGLALYNGLVGLGNGYYIIKDINTTHLAGIIDFENKTLEFIDETGENIEYFAFILFRGNKEEALSLAEEINSYPVLKFKGEKEEIRGEKEERGCGCSHGGFSAFLPPIISFLIFIFFKELKLFSK